MAHLNESFDFNSIATPDVRKAFRGSPSKEFLGAQTKLYKWTEHPLIGPKGITSWWSLVASFTLKNGTAVPGLQTLQERGSRLGVHERDYSRVRSAVTDQWNSMRNPLFIELIQPVWTWIGQASGQLANNNEPNVLLIGGSYQVWLPNLTAQYVKQFSALPHLQAR
jgi:hypothetical protein